jgi:peptidoglycan/xylan/chitin deacetylase (PgdA/CDA1 family)
MKANPSTIFLKRAIRWTLHFSGAASVVRKLRPARFQGCRVINFHRILPATVGPNYYARHMNEPTITELEILLNYLRRSFKFITPAEFLEAAEGRQSLAPYSLMLTFDDGHRDFHEHLVPLLNRLELPATIFINTAAMDGEVLWFQQLFAAVVYSPLRQSPDGLGIAPMPMNTIPQRILAIRELAEIHKHVSPDEWTAFIPRICDAFQWNGDLHDERMMTWQELESVQSCPWITIGGHSVSHPFLPNCTDSRLAKELVDCARSLRQRLNLNFLPFSYPNGGSDRRVVDAVTRAGYDCSFLMTPGLNKPQTDRHQLFRHYVNPRVVEASFDLSFRLPMGGKSANPSETAPFTKV